MALSCNGTSLRGEAALCYPFERFDEARKNLTSDGYHLLEDDFNVSDVTWNLI